MAQVGHFYDSVRTAGSLLAGRRASLRVFRNGKLRNSRQDSVRPNRTGPLPECSHGEFARLSEPWVQIEGSLNPYCKVLTVGYVPEAVHPP